MAKSQRPQAVQRFIGGIADSLKEGANYQIPNQFYMGRSINFRDDPQSITLLPGAVKESGSTVTDLLKFGDLVPVTLTSFFHGNSGNVYSRTSAASWSKVAVVPSSHGNGLAYFSGDDYIYLAGDSNISRYGPTQNSPQFTANFLTAQGGIPLNTASILLASASSMYGSAPDTASLSVTGNITLETYFKANSLPTVGNSMTLLGKWDESGALRSYKLDLFGVSGYFGTGADGALTISSNTTEAPIDATCTGTVGTQSLSATNVNFVVGQVILIIQTQGTNAGAWERNTIQGYTAGTITTGASIKISYAAGAQVRVLKQYTNATINTGVTYTAKAWSRASGVGGILAFLANGTITVTGTITASGSNGDTQANAQGLNGGFKGGSYPQNGEGNPGAPSNSSSNNGNGGGGSPGDWTAGAGGGNGTVGQDGGYNGAHGVPGVTGGSIVGSADLTTMLFGGGGGSGSGPSASQCYGGNGGGIIFLTGVTVTVTGSILSNGGNGYTPGQGDQYSPSGAGAGGSILLKAQTATLGTALILANGGTGGNASSYSGGNGGNGRIHLDYLTSYTGTTTPTINVTQDNTLVTTVTIQARLGISNDGTAFEYLTQNLTSLATGVWNRLSVTWTASTSTAQFYMNAVNIGMSTGTKVAIHDNTSLLYVGANKTSVIANYFDGLLNDMRIINNVQSAAQIFANLNNQLSTTYAGLQAYYKFNSAATDATSNANNLTLVNTPTYSSDVPFAAATTRLDIDTQNTNTGQVYTLLTSISEASVDKLPFTPVNDPQSSVGFYVNAKGTGNWTVTVHDQQNRSIATQTILNANIPASGFIEFIYTTPWRLLNKQSYHMHLTVTTGTSSVVTGTTVDFSTAEYATYFGFLVTDTQFHPITQFQYQPLGGTLTGATIFGNERYIAVWDGATYSANFIAFPQGWHIRCFAQWRQYLAIAVWRGGNIYDFHQGRIYFWTGYQPAYDFFIDVPEGQINAMFGVNSDLYMFAGYKGNLVDYQGGYYVSGTGNTTDNKIKRMPLLELSAYGEVFPGALTMWRGLLHFGLYANSNSVTTQRGVYSYGTYIAGYPQALGYDYPISTANRGSTVSIGLTYPVGQNLIVGWQDGNAYGADVINFNNAPAPNGELQLLVNDGKSVWKDQSNLAIKTNFLPLKTGESITPEYSLERGTFIQLPTDSTLVDDENVQPLNGGRANEIQIGVTLTQTNGTSPTLLSLALKQDKLPEEDQF